MCRHRRMPSRKAEGLRHWRRTPACPAPNPRRLTSRLRSPQATRLPRPQPPRPRHPWGIVQPTDGQTALRDPCLPRVLERRHPRPGRRPPRRSRRSPTRRWPLWHASPRRLPIRTARTRLIPRVALQVRRLPSRRNLAIARVTSLILQPHSLSGVTRMSSLLRRHRWHWTLLLRTAWKPARCLCRRPPCHLPQMRKPFPPIRAQTGRAPAPPCKMKTSIICSTWSRRQRTPSPSTPRRHRQCLRPRQRLHRSCRMKLWQRQSRRPPKPDRSRLWRPRNSKSQHRLTGS